MSSSKTEADGPSQAIIGPLSAPAIENISATGDILLVVGNPTDNPARLRVLSTQLISTSSIFRVFFEDSLSKIQREGLEFPLPDDDGPAMRILMRIVHHQNYRVPSILPVSEVLKVAKAADKYDCTNAVRFAAHTWYSALGVPGLSNIPLETHVALITSTYLLKDNTGFRHCTRRATIANNWNAKALIKMFDEAIPAPILLRIVLSMDTQRAKAFENLETGLSAIPEQLMLRVPGLTMEQSNRILSTIVRQTSSSPQRLCGLKSMTLFQAHTMLEEFNPGEMLAGFVQDVILATTAVLNGVITQVKRTSTGVCLRCLNEDDEFPEDCLEHMR